MNRGLLESICSAGGEESSLRKEKKKSGKRIPRMTEGRHGYSDQRGAVRVVNGYFAVWGEEQKDRNFQGGKKRTSVGGCVCKGGKRAREGRLPQRKVGEKGGVKAATDRETTTEEEEKFFVQEGDGFDLEISRLDPLKKEQEVPPGP